MTSGQDQLASRGRSGKLPPVHEAWLPNQHTMYRPRHGKRQFGALISAGVFFCVPLLLLILGVRPEAFENRPLSQFPSLGQGWRFFTSLSPWAIDYLPFRENAIQAEDGISRGIFGEAPPNDQANESGPLQGPIPEPSQPDPERDKMRSAGYPEVLEGKKGWLYLGYDTLGACLPERPLNDVITALGKLRDVVQASGRQFVLVVAPDKTTAVPQYLPDNYVGKNCSSAVRAEFWRRVVAEDGAVDLRPALNSAAKRKGAPVYSSVDTHWTHDGGLVFTRAVAERIEPGVTSRWVTTPDQVLKEPGDLPPLLHHKQEYPLQTYKLATDGTTVRSRTIDKEFRAPLRLTQAPGTGVVATKVGLIADSFTLYATPYLAGGFQDITIVHSDTVGTDPHLVGRTMADQNVVVLELVERSLVAGINPLVDPGNVDIIGQELAKRPIR